MRKLEHSKMKQVLKLEKKSYNKSRVNLASWVCTINCLPRPWLDLRENLEQ